MQYTVGSIQYTVYCTQYTVYTILYTIYRIQYLLYKKYVCVKTITVSMAKEYEQILSHVQFHATIRRLTQTKYFINLLFLNLSCLLMGFKGWEGGYHFLVSKVCT